MFRWLCSGLCKDLQIALLTGLGAVMLVSFGDLFFEDNLVFHDWLKLTGSLLGALIVFFNYLNQAGNARTAVCAIFESEITNICEVMQTFKFDELSAQYVRDNWEVMKDRLPEREEDYVETFSKNIDKLMLVPDKTFVSAITGFYAHLKGSRDAILALRNWTAEMGIERRANDMVVVAQHLTHCLRNAEKALKVIQEDNERQTCLMFIRCEGCSKVKRSSDPSTLPNKLIVVLNAFINKPYAPDSHSADQSV